MFARRMAGRVSTRVPSQSKTIARPGRSYAATAPRPAGPDARLPAVTDSLEHPAVRRVVEAAAQRGVALEIRAFPESTHTAEQAARAVGARPGKFVKPLVFVSAREDGALEPILCLVSGPNR